jgi:hypothetical protein
VMSMVKSVLGPVWGIYLRFHDFLGPIWNLWHLFGSLLGMLASNSGDHSRYRKAGRIC